MSESTFKQGGNLYKTLKLGQYKYTPEEIYRDSQLFFSTEAVTDIPVWAWVRIPTQMEIIEYLKNKQDFLHRKKKYDHYTQYERH